MRKLTAAGILVFAFAVGLGAVPSYADCPVVPNGTTILAPETRPEGTIIFNADENLFQGCIGTRWIELQGLSGYMCGYVQGACPQPNTGQNGCLSDQALTWTTTSCSDSGNTRTIVFGMPTATGVRIGGNDSNSKIMSGRAFCGDLGLAYTNNTSTGTASLHWMDSRATTSGDATYWRDRGTNSTQHLNTVTCTDNTDIP